jgi:leucyl aminopeptidase
MKIQVVGGDPRAIATEALVVGVFEQTDRQPPWTVEVNRALGGAIADRLRAGDMRGRLGEVAAVPGGGSIRARRVVLAGLGQKDQLDLERLRRATGRVVRWLDDGRSREASMLIHLLAGRRGTAEGARAAAEAAVLAGYRSPAFGEKEATLAAARGGVSLDRVQLIEPGGPSVKAGIRAAAHAGQVVGESANLARRLAELPANLLPPRELARAAAALSKESRLRVTVHDEEWLRRRKMGAILGVAQGSAEPPRFIVVEHRPRRRARGHVALVGKGVTFDSGGLSLKPREDMERMKYDMSGAAAVLGTMRAASLLDLPVKVTAVIPAVENLPSGTAIKPGDVILSLAGKSIEVVNTDAEGRLILADGLAFAGQLKPDVIIDIATLTGACRIALGGGACGLTGNDQELIDDLRGASAASGERAWPLPLYDDYTEEIMTEVADLKNSAGRGAGALTAAAFLKAFAGKQRWAHLDIAGMAWLDKDRDYLKCGSSGFGVRLLTAFLEGRSSRSSRSSRGTLRRDPV